MAYITVYAFEVYSAIEDAYIPANVNIFASLEVINANPELRVIQSESLEVDSSLINERGRYHRQPFNSYK